MVSGRKWRKVSRGEEAAVKAGPTGELKGMMVTGAKC